VDFRLELVLIPVADIDRAKAFYEEKAGFNVDVDTSPTEEFRIVQLTPPGSSCSITIGKGITTAAPGSYRGTHLVVTDIIAARDELLGRGVDVSEIRHFDREKGEWQPGPDPSRSDYNSFADFADPAATRGSCRSRTGACRYSEAQPVVRVARWRRTERDMPLSGTSPTSSNATSTLPALSLASSLTSTSCGFAWSAIRDAMFTVLPK